MFDVSGYSSSVLYHVNSHTKRDIDHANLNKRVSVLTLLKQSIVCPSLFNELIMHIKRVFGHTKSVVLVCCERAITFVPEIMWRVTYNLHFTRMEN